MKLQELKLHTSIANIHRMYMAASDADIKHGLNWYSHAQLEIQEAMPDVPLIQAAALVASVSPRMPWERNIEAAQVIYKAAKAGLAPDNVKVCTFNANKRLAFQIAVLDKTADRAIDYLKGPKTKAFACNLAGDYSQVTVDGHALNIAMSTSNSLDNTPSIGGKQYHYVAGLYQEAAIEISIEPAQLQAITWLTYRRFRGIS